MRRRGEEGQDVPEGKPQDTVTTDTLRAELIHAQRRLKAIESVLLALISQEFNGDARRMAREILDLRMALTSEKT